MKIKKIIVLFTTALALSNFNALAQKTTIWLVRHAEKATIDSTDRDPQLSATGNARAIDLATELKREKIKTIYCTNTKRTIATAKPLATLLILTPVFYDAKNSNGIATKALQENKGTGALIVGHSNTLIPVIKALNCNVPFEELSDNDYDMLFKVVINNTGKARFSITRYGAKHHTTQIKPPYSQTEKPGMSTPVNRN